jgi:hypothetical protein
MSSNWYTASAVCIIATCLCGCTTDDPPPLPHLASKGCAAVAEAHMNDARVNDYSARDQQVVFRDIYTDCVQWEAKGYEPPPR